MEGNSTFMDKVRSFFGIRTEPPRNDFRNPIWNTDDDDDDDELYSRQQMDVFDAMDLQRELSRQMQDMFNSFGSMFGDVKTFFHDSNMDAMITDIPTSEEPEHYNNTNTIRDYYLKPGYHSHKHDRLDGDLDGKISSQEISGLLNKKDDALVPSHRYDNTPAIRSFCQTIITTSVTKPDGTIETRRIVKKGNDIVEETTTTTEPNRDPININMNAVASTGIILSELASLFKNFY
ncbi:PREDICTED: uncharacterized protein LOC106106332 [Papilio polytes]|uniref:uncharacterized protein LOC106106332 n=1 Tax=Papilio polytes TaxID=76194 RepID=UPI0006767A64|nr:PREDICTED: uncharacterized protein LOC106106332 [Papilio polytes]